MKRVPKLLRSVHFQPKQKSIYVEVGSSMTRIKLGQKLIFEQPSCIAIKPASESETTDSGSLLAIGDKAFQLLGKKRPGLRVEFPVIGGAVASPQLFSRYMHQILHQLKIRTDWWQQLAGRQCYVALSKSLSPSEREVSQNQFGQLRLGQLKFASAELAVAANLGRNQPRSAESFCIINMGGMITTAAIVQRSEVVTTRSLYMGGMQLTAAIQQLVRSQESLAIGWHEAERIKRGIGRAGSRDGSKKTTLKKMSVLGKDVSSQLGRTAVVNSDQVSACINPLLADLVLGLQHFFATVPTELVTNCLQNGILLTGGASQLAGISEELGRHLQAQIVISETPEFDVIDGLGLLTEVGKDDEEAA